MVASVWGELEEMIGFQTYCEDPANRFAGGWVAEMRESKETDRREKEGRGRPGLWRGRTCCRLRWGRMCAEWAHSGRPAAQLGTC